MPLKKLRKYKFLKKKWKKTSKGLIGRHCEISIRSLGLAIPQYTRLLSDSPEWMKLGFDLFKSCGEVGAIIHETFPSASYSQLSQENILDNICIPTQHLKRSPKDMLDASMCAYTIRRFEQGFGCEVGGGYQMGTIVLPCQVSDHPVLSYPQS